MAIFEYTIASFLTLLALSSAKHLYILSTKAGFSVKKNLTDAYRDFLTMRNFELNENHAVIKNKFGNIVTYNTKYALGHNPQVHYVNYYFRIKAKDGAERTLDNLKKRLSIFDEYHALSWKNVGNELIAVYVKNSRITDLEFNEIISSLGGSS